MGKLSSLTAWKVVRAVPQIQALTELWFGERDAIRDMRDVAGLVLATALPPPSDAHNEGQHGIGLVEDLYAQEFGQPRQARPRQGYTNIP